MEWEELSPADQGKYIAQANQLHELGHFLEVDIEELAKRIYSKKP